MEAYFHPGTIKTDETFLPKSKVNKLFRDESMFYCKTELPMLT